MNDPSAPESPARWQQIRAKLEAVRPQLVRNGNVRARRERGGVDWQARYTTRGGGRQRQPAIYLGDERYARLARQLIKQWRHESVSPEERARDDTARLIELFGSARDYSGRAKKRLRAATRAALENPREGLNFVVGLRHDDSEIRFGRSRGRPTKSGLW